MGIKPKNWSYVLVPRYNPIRHIQWHKYRWPWPLVKVKGQGHNDVIPIFCCCLTRFFFYLISRICGFFLKICIFCQFKRFWIELDTLVLFFFPICLICTGWRNYLARRSGKTRFWISMYEAWVKSNRPLHVVVYHRLVNDTLHELEKVCII